MTDKSAAAVRELAKRIFPLTDNEKFYNTLQKSFRKDLIEGVTALIEEHYYPKEFTEWVSSKGLQYSRGKYYVDREGGVFELTTDELYQYWKENVR